MRSFAISLLTCGALSLVIGSSAAKAAMLMKTTPEKMSLVEEAKKKKSKYRSCTNEPLLGKCCTTHTGEWICLGVWK